MIRNWKDVREEFLAKKDEKQLKDFEETVEQELRRMRLDRSQRYWYDYED